jgi:hypothetical protein
VPAPRPLHEHRARRVERELLPYGAAAHTISEEEIDLGIEILDAALRAVGARRPAVATSRFAT